MRRNVGLSSPLASTFVGVFLDLGHSEHHVLRGSVLFIVLTLAVGQDGRLLCRAWCDPQVAAASDCQHEKPASSTSVAGDSCHGGLRRVAAVSREDVRRRVSVSDAAHAIVVPRYPLAHLTIDTRPGDEPGRAWSLERRPVSIALRT
jgi:hypothetical protein